MKKTLIYSKKIFLILLSIIMLLTYPLIVNAAVTDNNAGKVDLMYTTIDTNSTSVSISGIKATCYASLKAKKSTTLKIKMELQKKKSSGYETVETWTSSKTGTALSVTESRNINILCDYRLKATFTAGTESTIVYKYPS